MNKLIIRGNYNEMDFKRIQNGVRKQPDYILVFRNYGKIINMQRAIEAQRDWGNKIPIVIVDIDKCLQAEKMKIKQMLREYKENNNMELAKEIIQKVNNNLKTCTSFKDQEFVKDYLMDIKEEIKSIKEQLKSNIELHYLEDDER